MELQQVLFDLTLMHVYSFKIVKSSRLHIDFIVLQWLTIQFRKKSSINILHTNNMLRQRFVIQSVELLSSENARVIK